MTHPNLLRLVRSCAKWRSGLLLVATLFLIGPFVQGFRSSGRSEPAGSTGGGPPAPGIISDLRATPLTDSSVVLEWTEVKSGTTGIARYVVRYDTLGGLNWPEELDVLSGGCAAPIVGSNAAGGKSHACVLSRLQPNRAYEIQMVPYTGTLNTTAVFGPLSNVAEVTTMQRVGPILVWRPRMFRDTVAIVTLVSPWGTWQFAARLAYGDYEGTVQDSTGMIVGRAYLLLVKP